MTDKIVVFNTCASAADAEKLAQHLVETRVAACVNIIPGARSIYRWQGKVEDAAEHVLLIKTSRGMFPALRAAIQKTHPYDVPEIIAVAVVDGSQEYLDWLGAELGE